ncbi:MAG: hypothetical protein PSN35_07635 [Candidatus Thioglobus sp.]|uniref:hypothetical protein n=1 Tax=Candidatus Thioglobus sp. TaxID=2026721 RepID=UPI00261F9492|nr:hypothetical protein [Candidatus Thioglobus sp.]MDC9727684.1 hypothetical protein [Candidatus Thioglobus sp.]
MFDRFFQTKNSSNEEVILFGDKQQKFEIILGNEQQIEYFQLDEIIKSCKEINSLKACDYVLADHKNNRILLCELKNSNEANTINKAKLQLEHSKHIVNLFLNVLGKSGYLYTFLTVSKRSMNKKPTKRYMYKKNKYRETSSKALRFNELQYE